MRQGRIAGIWHQRGSGIATVLFDNGDRFHTDAGPLFRALNDAFGGHPFGRMVEYETNEHGLVAITPTDEGPETPGPMAN